MGLALLDAFDGVFDLSDDEVEFERGLRLDGFQIRHDDFRDIGDGFAVKNFDRKSSHSSSVGTMTYPSGNLSGLFFTARFTRRVSTPYNTATSRSRITFSPRSSMMAFATSRNGMTSPKAGRFGWAELRSKGRGVENGKGRSAEGKGGSGYYHIAGGRI